MPIFDEGGNTGAARSTIFDVFTSLFDKDRRKPMKGKPTDQKQDEQQDDQQNDEGSKWF